MPIRGGVCCHYHPAIGMAPNPLQTANTVTYIERLVKKKTPKIRTLLMSLPPGHWYGPESAERHQQQASSCLCLGTLRGGHSPCVTMVTSRATGINIDERSVDSKIQRKTPQFTKWISV